MCPNLQLNAETKSRIAELTACGGIPDFNLDAKFAAFHVRQSDETTVRESRKFEVEERIQKLPSIAPDVAFEHCFVASDNPKAINEIRDAVE
jgi:hypothetical protein